METKKLSKVYNIVLAAAIMLMMIACILVSVFGTQSFAKDGVNDGYNLATDDLWASDASAFNHKLMQELIENLTGNRGASIDELKTLIETSPDNEYGSQIVKSPTINANAGRIQPGREANSYRGGLVITLKGKEFRVTSLTLDDNDNIVMTLLLKDTETEVQWNSHVDQNNLHAEPSNMYGTSEIRNNVLLGTGGWQEQLIGAGTIGQEWAQNYLVQPKNIAYQRDQSLANRPTNAYTHSLPNDALGDVKGYFGQGTDESYDYYNNGGAEGSDLQKEKSKKYTSWGDDYIWLPSLTETGSKTWSNNIWQMPISQIGWKNGLSHAWLRSGNPNGFKYAFHFNSSGENDNFDRTVTEIYGLRPAMHFNLSTAMENLTHSDLWDDKSGGFDNEEMDLLLDKLTGKTGATLADVKNLIDTDAVDEYGSQVVKAPVINTNSGDADKGIIIRLKGMRWRVTSLTLDDNDNIVATLMLVNPLGNAVWNADSTQNNNSAEPSNMYGTSDIRDTLLNSNGAFADFALGDFAQRYLVQPKSIAYQRGQSLANRPTNAFDFSIPNDALGDVKGYYGQDTGESYDYYNNGDADKRAKYTSWGNDYIWLPSLTETGSTLFTDNIWQMPISQIGWVGGEPFSWMRSSNESNYQNARVLNKSGEWPAANVDVKHGLRPAVHLNLSTAMDNLTRPDIWDEETGEFNDAEMNLLLDKLTGKTGATLADVRNLIDADAVDEYGSQVVKAPVINTNSGDADKGIIITLKGLRWRVTSLTLDDNDNIVATLMLMNPLGSAVWNADITQDNNAAEPSNLYGTSDIRDTLHNTNGAFADFAQGDFAESYLVQPNNIAYQRGQSLANRPTDSYEYSLPNDALGDVKKYFGQDTANSYDYYNNGGTEDSVEQITKREKYTQWGNDYIWLPSLTETGSVIYPDNIWQMPLTHIGWVGEQTFSWLRTGNVVDGQYARLIQQNGSEDGKIVDEVWGVRPAVHLNLSAAMDNVTQNEIWDEEKEEFIDQEIKALLDKFTGTTGSTLVDVARLFDTDAVDEYGSQVVKAPVLNANSGIADKGIIIKLKGMRWRVTSLTIDDDNNIVATLMLMNPLGEAVWNEDSTQNNNTAEPSNMYGTSDIRDIVTNPNGAFADFALGSFAESYLIQPKNIAYQRGQSLANRPIKSFDYSMANDALGDVKKYYGQDTANSYDYYNNGGIDGSPEQLAKREKYNQWGNDYIWVPSMTETGSSIWTDNIWQMPIPHISWVGEQSFTWLRSGGTNIHRCADHLDKSGKNDSDDCTVTNSYGVRPAVHLNLSAIAGVGANADVDWQHSNGDSGSTDVPSGEGATQSAPLEITFTGAAFVFGLKTNLLADLGVGLDTSAAATAAGFVGGYKNEAGHRDVNGGAVFEVTVRIARLPGYVFRDEFGVPTAEQYREIMLYVRINKMILDKPIDNGETYTYNGEEHTFDYSGYDDQWMTAGGELVGTDAGSYTAEFTLKESANTEWSGGGTDTHSLEWNIDKLQIAKPTLGDNKFAYNTKEQTYLPNGYDEATMTVEGNTATNVDKYDATIGLIDPENTEWTEGGSEKFTLKWEIYEAKYNLSGVKWGTSEFEYDTTNKTMQLSGLPEGLSVTYSGQHGTAAGDYVAKVEQFKNTDSNYMTPNANDPNSYEGEFEFTKDWKIAKHIIELKWEFEPYEGIVDGLPIIKDDPSHPISYSEVLNYIYQELDKDGNVIKELSGRDEIIVGLGTPRYYKITAEIKSDPIYANNYEFSTSGNQSYTIVLSDDKIPVNVSLEKYVFTYNGSAVGVKLICLGLIAENFVITYYDAQGQQLTGAPTDAGLYRVKVELAEDKRTDYYIDGDSEFDITINKAKLSLEGVKWGYDAPYVYEWLDGAAVEYEVTLSGLAGYLADKAVYVNNTSSIVGTKTAEVTFNIDANNYEFDDPAAAEALTTLTWEVKARVFNKPLKNHTVVYDNTEHNLAEFGKLEDGWENYFDVKFTKNGNDLDGNTAKDAGLYIAKFSIKSVHKNDSNNNVFWEGNDTFEQTVNVTVEQRKVVVDEWLDGKPPIPNIDGADAPYYQIVYTYDGQIISLDDIEQYYGKILRAEVRIADGMDANNVVIVAAEGAKTYAEFIIFDSAIEPHSVEIPNDTNIILEYDRNRMQFEWADFGGAADDAEYLTISLPEGGFGVGVHSVTVRIRSTANAIWSDGSKDEKVFSVEIIKGKIEANWDKATPPELIFGDETDELIEYLYYNSAGTIVTEFNKGETYTAKASIRAEFADKYAFWVDGEYKDTVEKVFTVPSMVADLPTIAEPKLEYNGAAQTFKINGFNSEFMSMTGELKQTNAGKYSITISLTNGAIWADGTTDDITLEFEITKKKLNADWDTSGDVPKLNLGDLPADAVDYKYFGEDGKEVSRDNLVDGSKYTVRAELKPDYAKNYGFGADTKPTVDSDAFVYKDTDADVPIGPVPEDPNKTDGDDKFDFDKIPLWQIIVTALSIVLGLIFYAVAISNSAKTRRLKKEALDRSSQFNAFAGLPMIGMASGNLFWGMGNTAWTIIAAVSAGVCVVGLILMLITGHCKAVAEDDLLRAKRLKSDEDMKMMFMMMNGGRGKSEGGPTVYTTTAAAPVQDVKEIVTQVVAALMPNTLPQLPPIRVMDDEVKKNIIDQQLKVLDRQTKIIKAMNEQRERGESYIDDPNDKE